MENKVTYVYCHMTMATISNGQCGDGGWTLVMKIDGNQVKLKMNEWMREENKMITFPGLLLILDTARICMFYLWVSPLSY